ncbi:hypothetical protein AbraIFM66951_003510 [Aspergillus brasiliensis]|nr:hypothetical protein AbraIFM66951_003510 [Aspergillus brasiliensis]
MAGIISDTKPQDPEKTVEVTTKVSDVDIGQITQLDEAEIFLHEHGVSHDQLQQMLDDPIRTKKLRRRIDMILLPLMCGTYCLQYIDKQALSYSAVFDLFTDAHINSNEYSWLASIFYFGYLFWEYPASYIAQRLPIGTVVSSFVIAWGAILMITASCNNFTGLAICRFLLGCFESPITPCFMMIVGMWYLRQEQPFRAGIFYCCNGVGSMVGGLLTYAIGQLNTFPVWRAVFLICGGATIIWGVVMMIFLPNSILSSKRFSDEEKIMLIGRGKKNQTFGKLIIKGLVSSPLLTTVLGIPQGAFQVLFILTGTYLSTRFHNIRTLIMIAYLIPTVIGVCLLWKFPRDENEYGVLFGYYIIGSFVTSLVLALHLPASNMGGYTKRVTATAFVFLAYCIGNIIGPHAFLASEAPVYQTGCKLILGCAVVQMVCAGVLRGLLVRRNKLRDLDQRSMSMDVGDGGGGGGAEGVMADLTDFEVSL